MNSITSITVLVKYIEENLRVSDQTSINYIDPRGHITRLNSKQNQIIFGRRGSGKSLLVRTLKRDLTNSVYTKVNIEDFKDVSFPNSILQVLINFFEQLKKEVKKTPEWFEFKRIYNAHQLCKKIELKIIEFKEQLLIPDTYTESIKQTDSDKTGGTVKFVLVGNEFGGSGEITNAIEIQRSFNVDKLNNLRNTLTELKQLVGEISTFLNKQHINLILDDFYFIKKVDQSIFADFFHRLSKDTTIYLKIATIKHRSALYSSSGGSITGIEIGHDAQAVELDYTLDQFPALSSFMWDLLLQANTNSNAGVELKTLISENAFRQLCLASGGVPRDFLSLFIRLCNKVIAGKSIISKTDVNEIAIENYPNKLDNFKIDSAEEKDLLELYLGYIREFLLTIKNTNICLVSNNDLGNYSQIKQALKELVDLRLLHLVDSNTSSAPSDGKRYSAYMIDIGLYPNSKPRNFNQIEPGIADEAGRKDQVRAAPKIDLTLFKAYIDSLHLSHQLNESD